MLSLLSTLGDSVSGLGVPIGIPGASVTGLGGSESVRSDITLRFIGTGLPSLVSPDCDASGSSVEVDSVWPSSSRGGQLGSSKSEKDGHLCSPGND